jgi:nicotinamidase/pyrazinamidase
MAEYDARTALLVVDVQNDFADPKGNLYVKDGEDILPIVNAEIRRAREAGALVVYTQDWHPESTPHFKKDGGIWPVHCVKSTWGSEFLAGLEVIPEGEFIHKGTGGEDGYSAFTVRDPESGETEETPLESLLREHGISRVVIGGIATDYCVKESVLDATAKGFQAVVLTDAVRAVNLEPSDGDRALDTAREAGAVLE